MLSDADRRLLAVALEKAQTRVGVEPADDPGFRAITAGIIAEKPALWAEDVADAEDS